MIRGICQFANIGLKMRVSWNPIVRFMAKKNKHKHIGKTRMPPTPVQKNIELPEYREVAKLYKKKVVPPITPGEKQRQRTDEEDEIFPEYTQNLVVNPPKGYLWGTAKTLTDETKGIIVS